LEDDVAMSSWLSQAEMNEVAPAETAAFPSPVPTQVVSNGEYNPLPQTARQRQVEARIVALGEAYGTKTGMGRRAFLQTAAGMAAAFLAMNHVYGPLFAVTEAEAADPEAAAERAAGLAGQWVFDDQVHFVRDDYKYPGLLDLGRFAAKHWNPKMLQDRGIEIGRYKFENFLKEIFLDSDTKVALLSGAPFDDPKMWLLSNDQMARTRELINRVAGSPRLLCHAVFTPGTAGWMDEVDRAITKLKPDSWKGYTVGDPLVPSRFPWRLDDEKLVYPFYEKVRKAGITTICIHKGLMPRDYERAFKGVWKYATVEDVPKAARDWPDLNFVIYHAALRPFLEVPEAEAAEFEKTGYIPWASDLAALPGRFGVKNVYAEIGTAFATTVVTNPRLAAGLLGTLIKGMGADHVIWGTDSVWYGSPQWQIEALRRLEIPEDLQKKYGFAPLGPADGAVKNAIFWDNGARFYRLKKEAHAPLRRDGIDKIRREYQKSGLGRSNAAYGYIRTG
jgi:predicted TIM-barrel fold metal-dependent hydrolase